MESIATERAERGSRFLSEPPFDGFVGLARHIALAGIAGLLTGILVGGIGGRLFMRLAGAAAPEIAQGARTEAGFTVGEMTFGGSLGLVIFIGIFTGILGAILFVAFFPWLLWAGRWRGMLFGAVLFAIGSATSDMMNPDNIDFFILKNSVLLVVAIFFLFIAFALVMNSAYRFLDQRLPHPSDSSSTVRISYIVLSLVGLMAFVAVLPAFFSQASNDSFCQCDAPIAASLSMVLAGIGTIMWWATALVSPTPVLLRRIAPTLGYVGVVGVLLFGLFRAITDAIEIII